MVLQNSSKKNISLANELTTLQLYIELEQVRFKNHFHFSISVNKDVDTEGIMIPPLLLQPFVENSIWHGLMPKEEEGNLTLNVSIENDMLYCTITDDGIGRPNSSAINNGQATSKKSMGLQITTNRVKMLNEEKGRGSCTIIELKDANNKALRTKVIVKIPLVVSEPVDA
jgi:LytS/YehU family sensor histidine kinase